MNKKLEEFKRYKFLRADLTSGDDNEKWTINKWKKFEGELNILRAGFRCSAEPYNAFSDFLRKNFNGNNATEIILAEVEVRGSCLEHREYGECFVEVWTDMKVVKVYPWTKKDSLRLAIFCAELVLKNFERVSLDKRPREAIEAAKKVLLKDTDKTRSAAVMAAWASQKATIAMLYMVSSVEDDAESAAECATDVAMCAGTKGTYAAYIARNATSQAWLSQAKSSLKFKKYFRKILREKQYDN